MIELLHKELKTKEKDKSFGRLCGLKRADETPTSAQNNEA